MDRTKRFETLAGGISIGSEIITAGTLSGVFVDKKDGKLVLVSNWHVFEGQPGKTKVLQPGPYDGGGKDDVVGVVKRFVELDKQGKLPWWKRIICFFFGWLLEEWCLGSKEPNRVDVACASFDPVDPNRKIEKGVYMDDGRILHPSGTHPGDEIVGKKVWKVGRTTGFGVGEVVADSAKLKVWYGDRWILFEDVVLVEGRCEGGDSGSPVFLMKGDQPSEDDQLVGLLFAGSSRYYVFCKYKNIVEELGVEWV